MGLIGGGWEGVGSTGGWIIALFNNLAVDSIASFTELLYYRYGSVGFGLRRIAKMSSAACFK